MKEKTKGYLGAGLAVMEFTTGFTVIAAGTVGFATGLVVSLSSGETGTDLTSFEDVASFESSSSSSATLISCIFLDASFNLELPVRDDAQDRLRDEIIKSAAEIVVSLETKLPALWDVNILEDAEPPNATPIPPPFPACKRTSTTNTKHKITCKTLTMAKIHMEQSPP